MLRLLLRGQNAAQIRQEVPDFTGKDCGDALQFAFDLLHAEFGNSWITPEFEEACWRIVREIREGQAAERDKGRLAGLCGDVGQGDPYISRRCAERFGAPTLEHYRAAFRRMGLR